LTVHLHARAEIELEEAFDHYTAIRPELGEDLLSQFRQGVE
jgi:hypothetical protein